MKIKYRPLAREDYPQLTALTSRYVNAEREYQDYMKSLCDSLGCESAGIGGFDADGVLVGAALVEKGMHLTGGREDFFAEIRADIGEEEIWSGGIIVVEEKYQNKKVGAALLIHLLSHFEDIGAKHLLLEIWVRPDGYAPSESQLYIARSFTEYGTVDNFYAEAPGLEDHVCEVCGHPCKCKAKIAVLHV
ncbi:MAG: hypothetical protein Q4D58_01605 [Synergistaceae bacterium]|nr:hypothetical protein [Synergistaceae bacterium]